MSAPQDDDSVPLPKVRGRVFLHGLSAEETKRWWRDAAEAGDSIAKGNRASRRRLAKLKRRSR